MTLKTILIALAIACILPLSVSADGIFIQSDLSNGLSGYTYMSQLNLPETDKTTKAAKDIQQEHLSLALGSSIYPVTPGDLYTLNYYDGKKAVTELIQIGSDYNASLSGIGTINAKGITYVELKKQIEDMINTYYQYSVPRLVLTECGVFDVRVFGEVNYSIYASAWGLSRLSDLAQYASRNASTRKITVISGNGSRKDYDLFNGLINGDEKDNPLITPDCQVMFHKAEKTVSLQGSAKRAGVYQIEGSDNLKVLIDNYGKGLTANGDKSNITVSKYIDGAFSSEIVDYSKAAGYQLKDGDMVAINAISNAQNYVIVQGALAAPDSKTGSSSGKDDSNKIFYSFVPGTTAEEVVRDIAKYLLPSSDSSSIYISRNGQKLIFDSSSALSGKDTTATPLMQGDVITIPFSQLFVTVTGGVNKPGTFTFIPDRSIDYYINMAGGYTADAKKNKSKIYDKNGDKLKKIDFIPAESTINIPTSHLVRNIGITAAIASFTVDVLLSITYTWNLADRT